MALQQRHPEPKRPQYAPHPWNKPVYGQKIQYAKKPDTAPPLDKNGIKRIQSIEGTLLYCGKVLEYTALSTLHKLSSQ
eukprot:13722746-Ditylum_brightwellii.AAC.1